MPIIVSATGPEDMTEDEINKRRAERIAREKANMHCKACKLKKKKHRSLISNDLLCKRCIKCEAKQQKHLDSEEKLWFPMAEWLS